MSASSQHYGDTVWQDVTDSHASAEAAGSHGGYAFEIFSELHGVYPGRVDCADDQEAGARPALGCDHRLDEDHAGACLVCGESASHMRQDAVRADQEAQGLLLVSDGH